MDGCFTPHPDPLPQGQREAGVRDEAHDEARLLYVAMTPAMDELVLTYAASRRLRRGWGWLVGT
jgi:superfamily I DNA/RNA helicase